MNSKGKSLVVLAVLVIAAALFSVAAFFGVGSNGLLSIRDIKLGLDLSGGVSIVYQAEKEDVTDDEMATAVSLIQRRLDRKGWSEAEAARQGTNRIRVEIPGVEDAEEAINELGKTAQLQFLTEDGTVVLTGAEVEDARKEVGKVSKDSASEPYVSLKFDAEGTAAFAEATKNNIGKPIYIVMDEDVISSPVVQNEISTGECMITGSFTGESAEDLASLIREGSMPFNLSVIEMSNIGARLGANALETSTVAAAIGIGLVFLFMLLAYRLLGFAADWALCIYLALEIIIISALNITLTLPGIAGVILSVGMAVDANVIIFERLKEEVLSGKTLRVAVKSGFSRALPAILDGNITTFIAALVLYFMGTGTIRGFAYTLMIGIVVSMFTAIVVTRLIIKGFIGLGLTSNALYGIKENKKEAAEKKFNVVKHRAKYFALSIVLIACGIVSMAVNGAGGKGIFNYDIEFTGGTAITVDMGKEFNNDDVAAVCEEVTGQSNPQIQKILGTNEVSIKLQNIDSETRTALTEAFINEFGITKDNILSIEDISATVSGEMQQKALIAVLISCVAMLIYITFRFSDFKMGVSSILALCHDVLIMLAFYAVFRIPVNNSFIAAVLTVLGYSINATIVIFDRVRENKNMGERLSNEDLVDISVKQTLRRSVYTSLTTFLAIGAVYVCGVNSVKEFALPIMVGVISGMYSSIFLSGPMWYMIKKDK